MSPTYSLERKTDRITLAHHLHRLRPQKHWDGWVIWNKIDFAMVYEMKFGQFLLHIQNSVLVIAFYYYWKLACENSRFSSLFAAGDVSRGGTSATQRQKFHTDDANQCLHNKSGSHGVPNTNLSNFTCLLVDFGKVLCSSANEPKRNSNASSREDYIPQILTVLLEILRVYIWPCGLLSLVCHS